jgi:hypothetical protein
MGILDEAIREHLELKRSRGATDSELQRLEDEAFGPPSRPGEPDFPVQEGAAAEQSGNGVAHEEPEAEATAALEAPAPPAEGEHGEDEAVEEPAEDLPWSEGLQAEPEAEAPTDEGQAEVEDATALYDQTADRELELGDLDLELDDQAPADESPPPETSSEPEEPRSTEAPEVPIESLDTVEHALPEEQDEDDEGDEQADEQDDEEQASEEEEDEQDDDVLADTPEFLKDAPEDDELWFEQGKPKDFDF